MAQAVSRWFLTAEARVRVRVIPCGIYGGPSGTGTSFSHSYLVFPLSVSFHLGCPCSYLICGLNSRHVCGRSSETQSYPMDMNSNCTLPLCLNIMFV
jgi:hypothetical protein